MSDSICGPSNALQNFQKNASVDRTLQQDRLVSRQAHTQGFRSQAPSQGVLDPEFAAFESNSAGPSFSNLQHVPGPFSTHAPHHAVSHPADQANWAADFQRLQLSGPSHTFDQRTGPSAVSHQGWQNEFMNQQQQGPQIQQQQQQQQHPRFASGFQSLSPGYHLYGTPMNMNSFPTAESMATQQPPAETFDETAFEAAFEQASADMMSHNIEESQTNKEELASSTAQSDTPVADEPHEAIRIGSDTIPQTNNDGTQARVNDADELARTAGHLLESVSHDQSQKFRESNFLALMRRIRDREVHVEGDEFRETLQPLHPGGKHYPEGPKSKQERAAVSADQHNYAFVQNNRDTAGDASARPMEHKTKEDEILDDDMLHASWAMIPPSDSILHHSHKLSEVQNSVQPTPPPPYSTATQHSDLHEDVESDIFSDEDQQAPIAIHIDASINIRGNDNSIVLPSSASESAISASPASSTPTASAAQHQRRTRLTDMTTSILAALHRTGVLNAARTSTPVEIHIATGIRIEGSRNTICSGSAVNRPLVGKQRTSGDGTSWKKRSQSITQTTLLNVIK
ncbi:peroxin-20 [Aspergillus affinis]|uniref:peroxin-20 n=1 Tax=Aspergillus affinis TaxID=1070780 RepID=UPI0022FDB178|nr:peroxin-20 [Aspergillus affinis]KAI9038511.1 peroxin-20 [Aspergillus affinis]